VPVDAESGKNLEFMFHEQEFLELVHAGDTKGALHCMRHRLACLGWRGGRVRELSSYLFKAPAPAELAEINVHGGLGEARRALLRRIQPCITTDVMMPEARLRQLLSQAVHAQREKSFYQDSFGCHSLLRDQQNIPQVVISKLTQHTDEVWFVKFSNAGTRIASGSKDRTAIIWSAAPGTPPEAVHVLRGHTDAVAYLAWSPDDTKLLTCGDSTDYTLRMWDTSSGACTLVQKHSASVQSCTWSPDGTKFASGCADESICIWSLRDSTSPGSRCKITAEIAQTL